MLLSISPFVFSKTPVTKELCQKWIAHSHKYMNEQINEYGLNKDGQTNIYNLWTEHCGFRYDDKKKYYANKCNVIEKTNGHISLTKT